ncbi:hypothetical protein [Thermocoleostomius sinensis]|uniref:Uncharacterized protein n=1 Tax=Thermocoleostomius sinensis A174 TaxID=2016057 RepID=A0A9E8ZEF7_9CYAN|nr:hypothetical protein [Thermocoleostomius sinensis]WAL60374.1 hypothetical protein OXH18_24960 [Thermocoleostomius sinensis A174]
MSFFTTFLASQTPSQTIAASAPIVNKPQLVERRATPTHTATGHNLNSTRNVPNPMESPEQPDAEVWLPQVWIDELAEMIDR